MVKGRNEQVNEGHAAHRVSIQSCMSSTSTGSMMVEMMPCRSLTLQATSGATSLSNITCVYEPGSGKMVSFITSEGGMWHFVSSCG